MPNFKSIVYFPVVDFGEVVLLVVVTGGKQSQLLVRLNWTRLLDLDWSLTKSNNFEILGHPRGGDHANADTR